MKKLNVVLKEEGLEEQVIFTGNWKEVKDYLLKNEDNLFGWIRENEDAEYPDQENYEDIIYYLNHDFNDDIDAEFFEVDYSYWYIKVEEA